MDDWDGPYCLTQGSSLDRSLLVRTMQRTYQELHPGYPLSHLARTVDQYLSAQTPLWWVEQRSAQADGGVLTLGTGRRVKSPVACLWVGDAVDQMDGEKHAYVFLLYVDTAHRRRGIGSKLMQRAAAWARQRGDRKISLQVFTSNTTALSLYRSLGYQTQSLWMTKPLH